MVQNRRLVNSAACAAYLGISGVCLSKWKRDAKLNFPKPYVIGGSQRFDLDKIDQWLESHVGSTVPTKKAAAWIKTTATDTQDWVAARQKAQV